jgi:hypothetical protein
MLTCLKRNLGITETCLYRKTFTVPRIQTSSTCTLRNLPATEKNSVIGGFQRILITAIVLVYEGKLSRNRILRNCV